MNTTVQSPCYCYTCPPGWLPVWFLSLPGGRACVSIWQAASASRLLWSFKMLSLSDFTVALPYHCINSSIVNDDSLCMWYRSTVQSLNMQHTIICFMYQPALQLFLLHRCTYILSYIISYMLLYWVSILSPGVPVYTSAHCTVPKGNFEAHYFDPGISKASVIGLKPRMQ